MTKWDVFWGHSVEDRIVVSCVMVG